MRSCIVGASGKLGKDMVQHALEQRKTLENDDLVHEAPRHRQPREPFGAGARGRLSAAPADAGRAQMLGARRHL